MTPQARLQPSAPISIARTSSRPACATLSEPVNVSTMISPNNTSAVRSVGSSTRVHQEEHTDEPGGASTVGHERDRERGNHHHDDRAHPESKIHRRRTDGVADED